MREAADDELESGKRGAKIAGDNTTPYSLAQYLAIRDSFADQWQPQGGIESAMVEMLSSPTRCRCTGLPLRMNERRALTMRNAIRFSVMN